MSAQTKIYKHDTPLTCEMLYNGITDSVLYKYEGSRLVIKTEACKNNNSLMRLVVNGKEDYISNTLAVLINNLLQKEKCPNIELFPMQTGEERKIKVVRD